MLNYNTACKYETPYKGSFFITQCFANGMVTKQYGVITNRHINVALSHKYDTKVKDYSSKICLTICTYNHQEYTSVLNI